MGKADKKEQFFVAIANANLGGIRYGLGVGGILPTTRNDEDLTPFMWATTLSKDRSLAEMIRYYDRKPSMLRECLEQRDDHGNTCMHIAVKNAAGHKCVAVLLDAWHTVTDKNLSAGLVHKNEKGQTPLAVCCPKAKGVIDEWLAEPEEDENGDDGEIDENGLTSTQRSKLKKKQIKEEMEAQRKLAQPKKTVAVSEEPPAGTVAGEAGKMPEPTWDEVKGWVQSVGKNKPLCELNVQRRQGGRLPLLEGGTYVDPALWWCDSLNRLQLELPKDTLTSLDSTGLARLTNLTHLILSGHALTTLPDSIKTLKKLKSLDVRDNQIEALPELPLSLESLDVSNNALTSLVPLVPCVQLVSLAVDGNKLDNLDELAFTNLTRLVKLTASGNAITVGPEEVGLASKLETLVLNANPMEAVPFSVSALKKLKTLKVDECPIKDKKVLAYIEKSDIKTLGKYLEKNSGGGGGGKKKKGKK